MHQAKENERKLDLLVWVKMKKIKASLEEKAMLDSVGSGVDCQLLSMLFLWEVYFTNWLGGGFSGDHFVECFFFIKSFDEKENFVIFRQIVNFSRIV